MEAKGDGYAYLPMHGYLAISAAASALDLYASYGTVNEMISHSFWRRCLMANIDQD